MTIVLASAARPAAMAAEPLDFGTVLTPPFGGEDLRIARPGSRWAMSFTWPPKHEADAAELAADLLKARDAGLRVPLPLLRSQGSPGTPLVDGAGQAGTSLDIKGLTPGYVVAKGYWLTIWDTGASGDPFLHKVVTAATADGSGDATVGLWPMLRAPFADGAAIELAAPVIQGLVHEPLQWEVPKSRLTVLSVRVREAK